MGSSCHSRPKKQSFQSLSDPDEYKCHEILWNLLWMHANFVHRRKQNCSSEVSKFVTDWLESRKYENMLILEPWQWSFGNSNLWPRSNKIQCNGMLSLQLLHAILHFNAFFELIIKILVKSFSNKPYRNCYHPKTLIYRLQWWTSLTPTLFSHAQKHPWLI